MQLAWFRIWTLVAVSISYDDNHYTMGTSIQNNIYLSFYLSISRRTSIDLMKENDFTLAKERSKSYPARTITDADNAGDVALQANTPTQAEILLHNLEQAAGGIDLHINVD